MKNNVVFVAFEICGIIPHCGIKRGEKQLSLFCICIAQAAQCIGIGSLCGGVV